MADIIINEKFRTLIPPLNTAEYTELEKRLSRAFGYMERVSH